MEPEIAGLKVFVSLIILWVCYFFVYRKARTDEYRQRLYDIRNELWDYARKKNLLDHPVHRNMRLIINGVIRTASVTSIFVIISVVLFGKRPDDGKPSLALQIRNMQDSEERDFFQKAHENLIATLLRHLFLTNFPICFFAWPIILGIKIKRHIDVRRANRRAIRVLDELWYFRETDIVDHVIDSPFTSKAEARAQQIAETNSLFLPTDKRTVVYAKT